MVEKQDEGQVCIDIELTKWTEVEEITNTEDTWWSIQELPDHRERSKWQKDTKNMIYTSHKLVISLYLKRCYKMNTHKNEDKPWRNLRTWKKTESWVTTISPNKEPIQSKWVFTVKKDNRNTSGYNSWIFAKGIT